MEIVIGIAIFAFLIAMMVIGARMEKKRREELTAWAASKGFSFEPGRIYHLDSEHPTFGELHRGDDRYAHNVMRGTIGGREVMCFDYHYKTESRDSKGRRNVTHHNFSAVIVRSGCTLKHLTIRPESFFDKIGEFFGMDDIDFESAEFSRRFAVKAKDKRWAYDILHPRAMEYLMAAPVASLSMDTKTVFTAQSTRMNAAQFETAIAFLTGFLDLVPEYVRRAAAEPPPLPEAP